MGTGTGNVDSLFQAETVELVVRRGQWSFVDAMLGARLVKSCKSIISRSSLLLYPCPSSPPARSSRPGLTHSLTPRTRRASHESITLEAKTSTERYRKMMNSSQWGIKM